MRKLIFYKGMFSTLNQFVDELVRAADSLNIPSLVMDIHDPGDRQYAMLSDYISEGDCVAVLFNNIGLKLYLHDGNFWETRRIPVYNILVDHPRNYDDVLCEPISQMHVLTCDGLHEDFCRVFFPKIRKVSFFPHGGVLPKGEVIENWTDRPIDVLYMGSNQAETSYPAIPFYEDRGRAWYEQSIRLLLREPDRTTEDVLLSVMHDISANLTEEEIHILMMDYAGYVEATVRRKHKLQIMRLLAENGFRTEVYGYHWENEAYPYPENITIHESVSAEDCIRLMGQSKIVFNIQPWFKDGTHPRIFDAMMSGAVSMTDKSNYLLGRFTGGESIVYYDLKHPEEIPEKVRFLLEHPEISSTIAARGREIVRANDTWKNRLEEILKMADSEQQTA